MWPIPSAVRSELKTVPSLAHQNNVVDPTCGTIFRGPSCQGLLFYVFSLSLLIFILVWTHKMAFLGQKECKKFLLIKRFGGPWDLWHFCSNIQVQASFTWLSCRVLKNIQQIFHKFCNFLAPILKYSLWLLRYQNQKKCQKMQNPWNYTIFIYWSIFFPFSYEFLFTFGGLYLTKFGGLDFRVHFLFQ